jgi:thioredoxin-dependent peroxiredoxin
VRDEIEQFREAGVQPFGVNPAPVAGHVRYAERFRFNFPLLSDPERRAADAYGALKADGKGIVRSVVLVGRDGTVRFAVRGAPSTRQILASLDRRGEGTGGGAPGLSNR